MDGGAWWATVHGVAKSWTGLSDFTFTFTFMHWRRKWQRTPVFLPGESQGRGSLVAAVYGVARSRTRWKWLSSSSSSRKYGKEFPENLVTATCSNTTERDVFGSIWVLLGGWKWWASSIFRYTVHFTFYDSEINDVPSPAVKTLSTYPSKVVFWNVLTSHNKVWAVMGTFKIPEVLIWSLLAQI